MIFQGVNVSGSMNVTGSFKVPTGATLPLTSSALIGDLFFDTTDDALKIRTSEGWEDAASATVPPANADVEYLVIAGGGGGGGRHAGAGGAGGYLSSSLSAIESGSTITVTVGAGGAGAADGGTSGAKHGNAGNDSTLVSAGGTSFTTVTSVGGGRGGGDPETPSYDGSGGDGGSGGGATYVGSAGSGTVGQGNDGGTGQGSPNYGGGGGGGASTVGANASGTQSGAGGTGLASSITGTSVTRAGGGGAGGWSGVTAGAGGTGGGGAGIGNASNTNATAGTANTGGGGGGGGGDSSAGGTGGSGVVILAYDSGSINGAGGIVGGAGNGRKYHQFNNTGTFYIGNNTDFQLPATSNLKLHLDAANYDSYPGTGTTWYDISGNNNDFTLDSSGITWNAGGWFDLEGGGATKTGGAVTTSSTVTLALWIKTTDVQSLFWSDDNSNNYIGAYQSTNKEYYNDVGSSIVYYQDLVDKSNIYDNIRTGNWIFVEFKSVDFSAHGTSNHINQYSSYTFSGTDVGAYFVYDKNLTAAESTQLYNATKSNFV